MYNEFSRYEDDFAIWRRDGYGGVLSDTFRYVDFLTDPANDQAPRPGTLWQHQWDAFLRVIYCHECLGKEKIGEHGLLLNIVTGGGKTAIIAALIAWLRIAHGMQKFVLLCPNLIVKDRLEDDFQRGKVFRDRGLLPDWSSLKPEDFALTTLGSGREGGWASLLGATVVLGNIHQFYLSNSTGQSNLSALMNGPDLVLFNDEAHNSPAEEYTETLKRLEPKVALRVDTTATPDRADGRSPDSHMIYEYTVNDALADGLIKTPVVYQPDIGKVELTYTDARTGEKKRVEEIDWEEIDRRGISATQWVTDDEPMRQQMAIALKRLQEQETRAKKRYQPILFVIAVCKADAEKATETLAKVFKIKTLLVTEDSDEDDRRKARDLGKEQKTASPYRAVVSILMLREGWDVPEVSVILLLRKFSSRVYGQQVVGRGLRRVRRKGIGPDEPQICAIVDHPKLEHGWLWDIFNSRIRTDVTTESEFDEAEDLPPAPPRQEIVRSEQIVDLPDEIDDVPDGEFDPIEIGVPESLANWREVLAGLQYLEESMEITGIEIKNVIGTELAGKKWKTMQSASDVPSGPAIELPDDTLREAIKQQVLEDAEELCVEAGYASGFKADVYGALMQHIRDKFLGASLGLADRQGLLFAWKMLRYVKQKVRSTPGLVGGIIDYANQ